MNILCPICSDLVNQAENIYVTKCGHIFHYNCLGQWIKRSKSCPQCRNKVTDKCMFRLYPTISNDKTGDDAATLQSRLDDAQLQLRQHNTTSKEKDDKISALNDNLKKNEDLIKSYEKELISRKSAVSALKEQLEYVKIQNKETNKLREENENLKKNIQTLNGLQTVLNATSAQVEQMLEGYPDAKTLATFASALKRALCESEARKNEIRDRIQEVENKLTKEYKNSRLYKERCRILEEDISVLKRKLLKMKRKVDGIEENENTKDESQSKKTKMSESMCIDNTMHFDTVNVTNENLGDMVNKIENADSPYLDLKQSSLALSIVLNRNRDIPTEGIKPSEFAIINSARAYNKKSEVHPHSIFHKKQPIRPDSSGTASNTPQDVFYDGLGGHSKLDVFPSPKNKPLQSYIPRVTAKHKLKRPMAPSGSQDIGKLLQKIRDK